jgi:hypothetical protein
VKKGKKFDCVQMKHDIQRQIKKEYAGLSEQEAHRIQMGKVMQNPILGPFYKKARSSEPSSKKRPSRGLKISSPPIITPSNSDTAFTPMATLC